MIKIMIIIITKYAGIKIIISLMIMIIKVAIDSKSNKRNKVSILFIWL